MCTLCSLVPCKHISMYMVYAGSMYISPCTPCTLVLCTHLRAHCVHWFSVHIFVYSCTPCTLVLCTHLCVHHVRWFSLHICVYAESRHSVYVKRQRENNIKYLHTNCIHLSLPLADSPPPPYSAVDRPPPPQITNSQKLWTSY